jgi:MFS family permease
MLFLAAGIGAVLSHTQWQFLAVFMVYGMALSCNFVGSSTMNITLSPSHDRTTYLSIMSAVTIPCMLIASSLSTLLWSLTRHFGVMTLAALCAVAVSTFFLVRIDDRHRPSLQGASDPSGGASAPAQV